MKPRLIHPVRLLLYKRVDSPKDPEFGRVAPREWSEPVEIEGQVRFGKYNLMNPTGVGNDPLSDGHVVFEASTWVSSCGRVGDELSLSGDRLIVTEVKPAAHYAGTNMHVHVLFKRRQMSE